MVYKVICASPPISLVLHLKQHWALTCSGLGSWIHELILESSSQSYTRLCTWLLAFTSMARDGEETNDFLDQ